MATAEQKSFNFYPTPDRPIPKPILIGAAFLAIGALSAIGFGRLTGVGLAETPHIASIAHRDIKLDERPDGSVAILDAKSDVVLTESGIGQGSFAVEVLRNMQRNRARKGVDGSVPFVVALKSDGRLVVEDPETPQQVELRAFGERQTTDFAAMLPESTVDAALALRDPQDAAKVGTVTPSEGAQ